MTPTRNYRILVAEVGEDILVRFDKAIIAASKKYFKNKRMLVDEKGLPLPAAVDYEEQLDDLIELRRYIIAQFIETWGSVREIGDALPTGIPMGRHTEKVASVVLSDLTKDVHCMQCGAALPRGKVWRDDNARFYCSQKCIDLMLGLRRR